MIVNIVKNYFDRIFKVESWDGAVGQIVDF